LNAFWSAIDNDWKSLVYFHFMTFVSKTLTNQFTKLQVVEQCVSKTSGFPWEVLVFEPEREDEKALATVPINGVPSLSRYQLRAWKTAKYEKKPVQSVLAERVNSWSCTSKSSIFCSKQDGPVGEADKVRAAAPDSFSKLEAIKVNPKAAKESVADKGDGEKHKEPQMKAAEAAASSAAAAPAADGSAVSANLQSSIPHFAEEKSPQSKQSRIAEGSVVGALSDAKRGHSGESPLEGKMKTVHASESGGPPTTVKRHFSDSLTTMVPASAASAGSAAFSTASSAKSVADPTEPTGLNAARQAEVNEKAGEENVTKGALEKARKEAAEKARKWAEEKATNVAVQMDRNEAVEKAVAPAEKRALPAEGSQGLYVGRLGTRIISEATSAEPLHSNPGFDSDVSFLSSDANSNSNQATFALEVNISSRPGIQLYVSQSMSCDELLQLACRACKIPLSANVVLVQRQGRSLDGIQTLEDAGIHPGNQPLNMFIITRSGGLKPMSSKVRKAFERNVTAVLEQEDENLGVSRCYIDFIHSLSLHNRSMLFNIFSDVDPDVEYDSTEVFRFASAFACWFSERLSLFEAQSSSRVHNEVDGELFIEWVQRSTRTDPQESVQSPILRVGTGAGSESSSHDLRDRGLDSGHGIGGGGFSPLSESSSDSDLKRARSEFGFGVPSPESKLACHAAGSDVLDLTDGKRGREQELSGESPSKTNHGSESSGTPSKLPAQAKRTLFARSLNDMVPASSAGSAALSTTPSAISTADATPTAPSVAAAQTEAKEVAVRAPKDEADQAAKAARDDAEQAAKKAANDSEGNTNCGRNFGGDSGGRADDALEKAKENGVSNAAAAADAAAPDSSFAPVAAASSSTFISPQVCLCLQEIIFMLYSQSSLSLSG
jgi:hypothetical protein